MASFVRSAKNAKRLVLIAVGSAPLQDNGSVTLSDEDADTMPKASQVQLMALMSWVRAAARHEYAMDYYGVDTDEGDNAALNQGSGE